MFCPFQGKNSLPHETQGVAVGYHDTALSARRDCSPIHALAPPKYIANFVLSPLEDAFLILGQSFAHARMWSLSHHNRNQFNRRYSYL